MKIQCKRCSVEFEPKDFEVRSHVIRDSAWLCMRCEITWLEVRRKRKLSNICYVTNSDKIDW